MHRIGPVLFDGFKIMSTAVVAVFEIANVTANKPFYEVSLLSRARGRGA